MNSSTWCPRLNDLLSAEACNLVREIHAFDGVENATAAALLLALPNGMAFVHTGSVDGDALVKAHAEAAHDADLQYVLLAALWLHDVFKVLCNHLEEPGAADRFDLVAGIPDKRARYVAAAIMMTMAQEAYPPWDIITGYALDS